MAIDKKLVVQILGDASGLKSTYNDITKESQKFNKEIERHGISMQAVGKTMLAVGGVIVGAMAATVVAVASSAGKIQDLANAAGVSAEAFQKMAYSAKQDGIQQEQLSSLLAKLTKNMNDARNGSKEITKAFDSMGISVTDSNGQLKTAEVILPQIADHFKGMTNPAEKAALAMELFGKTGSSAVAWLSQGSAGMKAYAEEAEKLGIILSNESVAALDQFDDSLGNLKAGFGGLGNELAADLVPILQTFADGLKSGLEVLNSIPGPVKQVIVGATALAAVVSLVGGAFIVLGPAILAALAPLWPFIAGAAALGAAAVVIYKNWDQVASFFMTVWDKCAAVTQIALSSIKTYFYTYIDLVLKGLNFLTGFIPGWGDKLNKAIVKIEAERNKELKSIQDNAHKLTENTYTKHLETLKSSHQKANKVMTEEEKAAQAQRLAAQKEAQEKAIKLQKEWHDKLLNETQTSLEKLNREEKEALNQTNLTEKAKQDIRAYYAGKRLELEAETAAQSKALLESATAAYESALESSLNDILRDEKKSKSERLESLWSLYDLQKKQMDDAYEKEKIAAIGNKDAMIAIEKTYELKSNALRQDYVNKAASIDKRYNTQAIKNAQSWMSDISSAIGQISDLYTKYYDNKSKELDNWYAKKQNEIESTITDETAKNAALEALDDEYNEKKNKIAREQAEKTKTAAIFDAIIKTAQSVLQALAAYPPPVSFVMAAAAAAVGAIQVKLIQDEPLPELAEGGIANKSTIARIGEGKDEEAVIPLNDAILSKIGAGIVQATNTTNNSSAMTNNSNVTYVTNVNVGTLIGDKNSTKKLAREITDIQASEARRRGQTR